MPTVVRYTLIYFFMAILPFTFSAQAAINNAIVEKAPKEEPAPVRPNPPA